MSEEKTSQDILFNISGQRSEEVDSIIERMPVKFGAIVTILASAIVILLVVFGFCVEYPDVVTGNITINAENSPIRLIAASSGKLKLLSRSQQKVKAGDYVGYLQNPANINDVILLKQKLKRFDKDAFFERPTNTFKEKLVLGEITLKYYAFVTAVENLYYFKTDNLTQKQRTKLETLLSKQKQSLATNSEQLNYYSDQLKLSYKSLKRDSTLFKEQVESESEFDKAKVSNLVVKQSYNYSKDEGINIREKIDDTENQLEQLYITAHEKEMALRMAVTSAYNDLNDNIKAWDQKYAFVAPINGTVQFLKFWIDNEYVQATDEMFTIVPSKNRPIGQVFLPAYGAGKVKVGQEAIIKLDNYPYDEYGTLKGRVSAISLTTNLTKDKNQTVVNSYLVTVELLNSLKTNYGTELDYKFELKGTADVVTKPRKLVERLFDNVTKATTKHQ